MLDNVYLDHQIKFWAELQFDVQFALPDPGINKPTLNVNIGVWKVCYCGIVSDC